MSRKICFVPGCLSCSTSGKVMIAVPMDPTKRKRWLDAVRYGHNYAPKTSIYCCEDHFDLEHDAENFMYFREASERIRMRADVVPHLNLNSPWKRRPSQISPSAAKRKRRLLTKVSSELGAEVGLLSTPLPAEEVTCDRKITQTSDLKKTQHPVQPLKTIAYPRKQKLEEGGEEGCPDKMAEDKKCDTQGMGEWPEFVEVKVEVEEVESFFVNGETCFIKQEHISIKECDVINKPSGLDKDPPVDGVTSETGLANPLPDNNTELSVQVKEEIPDDYGGNIDDGDDAEMKYVDVEIDKPQTSGAEKSSGARIPHSNPGGSDGNSGEDVQWSERAVEAENNMRDKPYSCDICDYKCRNGSLLKRHMWTHTGEKPYSCDACGYKCRDGSKLKTHMMIHTGEKPYFCNVCDFKCREERNLKIHMMIHSDEKPYSCDACDYKCKEANKLKIHMRIHTGEKPYSCSVCDFKCREGTKLKIHMRTHTGEKPYSCDVCDYKCSHAGDLKKHMTIHTGEKPYSCDVCGYKCRHSSFLKTHMRTHICKKT